MTPVIVSAVSPLSRLLRTYEYPQGIVFSMIITRIGLSVAWKGREKESSLAALKPSRQSAAVFKQTIPMVPDVIHVTTTVEEQFDETSDYDKGSPQWSAHSGKFPRPPVVALLSMLTQFHCRSR